MPQRIAQNLPRRPARKPRTVKRQPIKRPVRGGGKRPVRGGGKRIKKAAAIGALGLLGAAGLARGWNYYNTPYHVVL